METLRSLTYIVALFFCIKKVTFTEIMLPQYPLSLKKTKSVLKSNYVVYEQMTFPSEVNIVYSSFKSE